MTMLTTIDIVKQRSTPVIFDPQIPEHVEAFRMLCIGNVDPDGIRRFRQHPILRFKLEPPYPDLRTMMFERIGAAYINEMVKTLERFGCPVQINKAL